MIRPKISTEVTEDTETGIEKNKKVNAGRGIRGIGGMGVPPVHFSG